MTSSVVARFLGPSTIDVATESAQRRGTEVLGRMGPKRGDALGDDRRVGGELRSVNAHGLGESWRKRSQTLVRRVRSGIQVHAFGVWLSPGGSTRCFARIGFGCRCVGWRSGPGSPEAPIRGCLKRYLGDR